MKVLFACGTAHYISQGRRKVGWGPNCSKSGRAGRKIVPKKGGGGKLALITGVEIGLNGYF